LLTRTETDTSSGESRTTTNSYNALRLLASVDSPRTDVADITSFEYDPQGNLIKTTNALGHETLVTQHDAHGRPLSLTDPNGLLTELAYDARGRLQRQSVDGQITSFSYDGAGNVTGLTLPTGGSLRYTYDAAHRLTAIQDSTGNTITYTLDPLGNRIKEEITDPAGVLTRTHARVYTSLNRLVKDIGGEGQEISYGYDANGNRRSTIDGRGHETAFAFDALNRLLASTDPEDGITEYTYDALDNLIQVKDPKGLETTYTYNALGDLLVRDSPDTGTTRYAYDSAGNRVSQLDAKGVEVNYTYDALNRLTDIDYAEEASDVGFTYDEEVNGVGRLTTMRDGSGTTRYGYDGRGDLISV
ncbi:MAG: RHS repeat protein, partial [bacterium]